MNEEIQKWRQTFLQESQERLDEIESILTALENGERAQEHLDALFRAIHTIKGDSTALAFENIERLTHDLETLLQRLRDGSQEPTEETVDLILRAIDGLGGLLSSSASDSEEPETEDIIHALKDAVHQGSKTRQSAGSSDFQLFEPEAGEETPSHEEGEGECKSESEEAPPEASEAGNASAPPNPEDVELLGDFVEEAAEHLQQAEEKLLQLDSEPENKEALNALYRSFHTIKGLAGFLKLHAIESLSHQAESLLNEAREGRLLLEGASLDLAFQSIDALKKESGFVEAWLSKGGAFQTNPTLPRLLSDLEKARSGQQVDVQRTGGGSRPAGTGTVASQAGGAAENASGESRIKDSIRVDRDRLDKLINVIGELVIGASMVTQDLNRRFSSNELPSLVQLRKTVTDLQQLSLSMRMVPVGGVFRKMARIVRDLSRKMGKSLHFETSGDDTELDKTVVDQIGDPLMHMVRNAADHGIEAPEEREASGKPVEGTIRLRAYHQGGNIYIEVQDDGKGLDREQLIKKALAKGIIEDGATLSDQEAYGLIFAPGFSTAAAVTDISGRGVGMDVVRRNVEAMHGSVSVRSQAGKGTAVVIRLPLTLAILDGLTVRIGSETYIVPMLSIVESFRPGREDFRTIAGKGEVVMVRGDVLPLLRLSNILAVRPGSSQSAGQSRLVVILEDRSKKYALVVDEILGQSQVVIKNLQTNYHKVDGIAGATILGDGRVAMILDVFGLVSLTERMNSSAASVGKDSLATSSAS